MRIVQNVRDMLDVWWHELSMSARDQGVLIFTLLVPLGYPLLYYCVYSTEMARDVPAAVVDDCRSAYSREFLRRLDATPEMKIVSHCNSVSEARGLMEAGVAYGFIRIPSDFDRDILEGRQTHVGLYTDVSSLIYYKNLLLPCSNVSQDMNKSIKTYKIAGSLTEREINIAKAPVTYNHVQLYNPQGGYACFILPPIFMVVLQQTLVLALSLVMGRTRERNRGNVVYETLPAYRDTAAVYFGRFFVFAPLYTLLAIYLYKVVTVGFLLPQLAHMGTWVCFALLFTFTIFAFAYTCSFLVYRREDGMMIFVFMSVPLLFLSGLSWPASNLPTFWKVISYAFPTTFGMNAHVKLASLGASYEQVRPELLGLAIQCFVYTLSSLLLQHWCARRPAQPSRAEQRLKEV